MRLSSNKEIPLLLAESEFMRTAWVRRETGVDVLDDREGLRRYTQAVVSCLGPDSLIVVKSRCRTLVKSRCRTLRLNFARNKNPGAFVSLFTRDVFRRLAQLDRAFIYGLPEYGAFVSSTRRKDAQ